MNPYDDTDPKDLFPGPLPEIHPCIKCGAMRVLRIGDYCRVCAVVPPEPNVYLVIYPGSLNRDAETSGMAKEYLRAKMGEAFENNQHYVIFKARGVWQEILISDRFPVWLVMKRLFERLED